MTLYVQLEVNWADHPKLIRAGMDGRGLHATVLCLAKRLETDGWVDRIILHRDGADDELIERLLDLHLLEADGDRVRPWGWHDRNPTQEAIDAQRRAKSEAGKRGNHTRHSHPLPFEECSICWPDLAESSQADRRTSQNLAGASGARSARNATKKGTKKASRTAPQSTPESGHNRRSSQGAIGCDPMRSPKTESETESSSPAHDNRPETPSHPGATAAEAAGEEEEEGNPRPLTATEQTALVEAAIEHMAKCDHHHATLDGTHIRNPDAYRRRCADTRRQTHHDALTNLATRATTATDPIDLAEHLDPTCGPLDGGTERAARRYAQDQARIAAEDAEHAETVARREAAQAWLDQLDPTRRSELEAEAEATATRIGDRPPPYFVKQRLIALALDAMTADQEATA